MNLKSTLLALMLIVPVSVFSTDYYVRAEANGTGDGLSWETAMNIETFISGIATYEDGDNFYFWEGTYLFTKTVEIKDKALNLYGGYCDITASPDESALHKTIFQGAADKSLDCMFAYNASNPDEPVASPVTIQGISFTGVYYDALTDGRDNSIDNAKNAGALWFSNYFDKDNPDTYTVKIKNCNFYGNESASFGGVALTSRSSNVHIIDSRFTENKSNSRGGAIRLYCNRVSTGRTILERCLIANNEINENAGSALLMQHGEALYIINSTISQNSGASGAAVYVNGFEYGLPNYSRYVYIVSSTISGNDGGAQLLITNSARLYMANSVIVGNESSNYLWGKGAVAISNHDSGNAEFDELVSGDYNMIGKYSADPNNIVLTDIRKENDAISQYNKYKYVFGNNKLNDDCVIEPDIYLVGAQPATLKENVADWGIPQDVDLSVDMLGNTREGEKTRGSYAMTPIRNKKTLTLSETKPGEYYSTYYIDGGFIVPDGMQGAVVTKVNDSETLYLSFKYGAGKKIPAKTPVVLRSEKQKTFDVDYICISSDDDTNLLRGSYDAELTTTDKTEPVYYYKMSYDPSQHTNVAFYWGARDGGLFTNGANKAYIDIPQSIATGSAGAKGFICFDILDETTGIRNVSLETKDDVVYNLNGMRISVPSKGIYIRNGKKYIVK